MQWNTAIFSRSCQWQHLGDVVWEKKPCPRLLPLHRSHFVSSSTAEPQFLQELWPVGWFFSVARFGKLCLKLALITSLSCSIFGVWQKNALPTAVAVVFPDVCSCLGWQQHCYQWVGNALRGRAEHSSGCVYSCCHVAVHNPVFNQVLFQVLSKALQRFSAAWENQRCWYTFPSAPFTARFGQCAQLEANILLWCWRAVTMAWWAVLRQCWHQLRVQGYLIFPKGWDEIITSPPLGTACVALGAVSSFSSIRWFLRGCFNLQGCK